MVCELSSESQKERLAYRVTRRVVSGRSKQYLFRPETNLLVTLYKLVDRWIKIGTNDEKIK